MHMDYRYTLTETLATTGYFACEPPDDLKLEDALAALEDAPLDTFLHQHCLRVLVKTSQEQLTAYAATAYDNDSDTFLRPALASLLCECAILAPHLAPALASLPADANERLSGQTPLIYLRANRLPDHAAAAWWSNIFSENICNHHTLPHSSTWEHEPIHPRKVIDQAIEAIQANADALRKARTALSTQSWEPDAVVPPQEVALNALDALMEAGVAIGQEMRHESSLSPIALLRAWSVDIGVTNGRNSHTLQGETRAWGRGLSLAQARASCSMEIVERASTYVSVETSGGAIRVTNRKADMPLVRASYAELLALGRDALNPDVFPSEAPFAPDAPLHWLSAHDPQGKEVLVPAQAVFLFCNLDEEDLFLAGGSTGLAAGTSLEQAKVAALCEIMERDAEATTPFHRRQCFTIRSRDERLQSLLDDYAARGIAVQFQALTTEFGLPVYQCFVTSRDGHVARATAGKLSGPAAAMAALTETPWPYSLVQPAPFGTPSGPGLSGLPWRYLEDLPDYSLPCHAANLQLLETMLAKHGKTPLYVELTREDMGIPVVRAIIPGLELTAEWDTYSRPSARLFARALMLEQS